MIRAEVSGETAVLHGPFPFAFIKTVSALSGRKIWLGTAQVKIQANPANVRILKRCDHEIEWIDKTGELEGQEFLENLPTQHSGRVAFETKYQPRVELFAHQKKALEISAHRESYALLWEMGLGKSAGLIANSGVLWCAGKLTGVLVVAPKGVHSQWLSEQVPTHFNGAFRCVVWKKKPLDKREISQQKDELVWFSINIDALRTDKGRTACEDFLAAHKNSSMMIMDECFVAGTKISMADGTEKCIEDIVEGDLIKGAFNSNEVLRKFKGKSQELITLFLEDGTEIKATPNHPFFTDIGWLPSKLLKGRKVFRDFELRALQKEIPEELENAKILRTILFSEMEDVSAGNPSENLHNRALKETFCFFERQEEHLLLDRKETFQVASSSNQQREESSGRSIQRESWRERERSDAAPTSYGFCPSERLYYRISNLVGEKAKRLSYELQSRHWKSFAEDSDRSGRRGASIFESANERSEKGKASFGIRVESVESQKLDCPVDVFNLEVNSNPHYYANGIFVHNSHNIKDSRAQRTKAAIEIGKLARYRRIATGTPIAKNIVDAWSQFGFLNPDILGHRYMTSFRARYCIMGGWEGRQIIGQKNVEEFYQLIAPHAFRMTKEEALDLPPKIYIAKEYEMSDETAKHYKSIKETLLTALDDGTLLDAKNGAVAMGRLQQIVCGHLPREDETIMRIGGERLEVMMDIVRQRTGPIVIWHRFIADGDAIMAALEEEGEKAVRYRGTDAEREAAKLQYLAGEARVFVSNPKTGGVGLNLQGECETVIYYSNSFDALDRWQSEDRVHRTGMKRAVTYFDIIARKSVDRVVLRNLRAKKSISDLTLDDIRKSLKEGEVATE